jgi:hypothetical protein
MKRIRPADLGTEERVIAIGAAHRGTLRHTTADYGVGHMRKGILGSLAVLTAGAGLTFGQPKAPMPTPGGPPMSMPMPGAPMGPGGQPMLAPPGFEGMMPPGDIYAEGQGGPFGSGGGVLNSPYSGPRRYWIGADYLFWMPKSMNVDYPLVTTSAALDLGVVGRTTTASIGPNDQDISFDYANGVRGFAGLAVDGSGEIGLEAGGFYVKTASRQYDYGSNAFGLPVLAVPFVDVVANTPATYIVAFPGVNTGTINIHAETRIWGVEGSMVYNLYQSQGGPGGLTLLAGPRFLQLREQYQFNTSSQTFGVPPAGGALGSSYFPGGDGLFAGSFFGAGLAPYNVTTTDSVKTTNNFYGGQVGFRGDIGFGSYFINLTGKFGVGYMRQWIELEGNSTLTTAGVTSTQPGGLYNQAQDLFRHRRDQVALLGEGGVNLGYQIGSFLKIQGGYTFLWVNNVLRPTNSTPSYLVPNLVPTSPTYTGISGGTGPARAITTTDTDYHIHGFNLGVELSF